jgi:phasin family protein
MYPFPQSVNPAVRSHFDAQVAFLNDLSQTMTRSFQDMCQLNIQLGQTMLEETTLISQKLMTPERPSDAMSAAASRAQPAADKLRAYQQQLSRLAASAQVELARVTEQHVQQTSRTAHALADEVTRAASEETEKNMRQQEETLKNFRDPFKQDEAARTGRTSMQASGNLQSSGDGASVDVKVDGRGGSIQGNIQGVSPGQQSGNRNTGTAS